MDVKQDPVTRAIIGADGAGGLLWKVRVSPARSRAACVERTKEHLHRAYQLIQMMSACSRRFTSSSSHWRRALRTTQLCSRTDCAPFLVSTVADVATRRNVTPFSPASRRPGAPEARFLCLWSEQRAFQSGLGSLTASMRACGGLLGGILIACSSIIAETTSSAT